MSYTLQPTAKCKSRRRPRPSPTSGDRGLCDSAAGSPGPAPARGTSSSPSSSTERPGWPRRLTPVAPHRCGNVSHAGVIRRLLAEPRRSRVPRHGHRRRRRGSPSSCSTPRPPGSVSGSTDPCPHEQHTLVTTAPTDVDRPRPRAQHRRRCPSVRPPPNPRTGTQGQRTPRSRNASASSPAPPRGRHRRRRRPRLPVRQAASRRHRGRPRQPDPAGRVAVAGRNPRAAPFEIPTAMHHPMQQRRCIGLYQDVRTTDDARAERRSEQHLRASPSTCLRPTFKEFESPILRSRKPMTCADESCSSSPAPLARAERFRLQFGSRSSRRSRPGTALNGPSRARTTPRTASSLAECPARVAQPNCAASRLSPSDVIGPVLSTAISGVGP